MFGQAALERANNVLVVENRDLRDTIRREREAWAAERKELIDRIIALTKPAVAHILNLPHPTPEPKIEVADPPAKRRINFPGYVNTPPLPPYPNRGGGGEAA